MLEELEGRPGVGCGDQITLVHGCHKYIWTKDAPDEPYDLQANPEESEVLTERLPKVASDMPRYIQTWRASTEAKNLEGVTERVDAASARKLEALSYEGTVERPGHST